MIGLHFYSNVRGKLPRLFLWTTDETLVGALRNSGGPPGSKVLELAVAYAGHAWKRLQKPWPTGTTYEIASRGEEALIVGLNPFELFLL